MKAAVLLVLTTGIFLILRWQGAALVTPASPYGILDLEFAGTIHRVQELHLFWKTETVVENIYFDFLFIVSYVLLLLAALSAATGEWPNKKLPDIIRKLILAAGSLDVLENLLMLRAWNGSVGKPVLLFIYGLAALKFFLAAIVLVFLCYTLLLRTGRRTVKRN